MEIIEQIGSYAGLAAIVGLAVLSALYFSQARDVKRLREWAGRAPERAAQAVPPVPRLVAQPKPMPASPAAATPGQQPAAAEGQQAPPKPSAVPTPAIAAAAGASPATATAAAGAPAATAERPDGPGAATPAGQSKQGPADGKAPEPEGAGTVAPEDEKTQVPGAGKSTAAPPEPGAAEPGKQEPETAPAEEPAPAGRPPTAAIPSGAATPAGQARPTPPTPPRFARPEPPRRPVPQPTAIIPPGSGVASTRERLSRARIAILAVAGVLVVGGGAAFAVSQLTGDDGGATSGSGAGDGGDRDGGSGDNARRAVNPADVTVAVLNGTLVPGLAAQIGDEVERLGFDLGTLGNADDQEQQRAESVVLYASGHRREAVVVSRRLRIPQREQIDPDTQALAGDAGVVVIAGSDQTP